MVVRYLLSFFLAWKVHDHALNLREGIRSDGDVCVLTEPQRRRLRNHCNKGGNISQPLHTLSITHPGLLENNQTNRNFEKLLSTVLGSNFFTFRTIFMRGGKWGDLWDRY